MKFTGGSLKQKKRTYTYKCCVCSTCNYKMKVEQMKEDSVMLLALGHHNHGNDAKALITPKKRGIQEAVIREVDNLLDINVSSEVKVRWSG